MRTVSEPEAGPWKEIHRECGNADRGGHGGGGVARAENALWRWPTLGLPAASWDKGFLVLQATPLPSRAQV